jgi:hypothetical protein
LVVAGRKIFGAVFSIRATGTATITGTVETLCVFTLALDTAQIEQECRRDAFSLAGCEWTTCTVPITNTSSTQNTAVTFAMTTLRFTQTRGNDFPWLVCK